MECRNCNHYKEHNCKRQCMDLPDGMTCSDCTHINRCMKMFSTKPENRYCGFEPVKFKKKQKLTNMETLIINHLKESRCGFIAPNEAGLYGQDPNMLYDAIKSLCDKGIIRKRDCDADAYEWNDKNLLENYDTNPVISS